MSSSSADRLERRRLLSCLAAAAALRLLFAWRFYRNPGNVLDVDYYVDLAQSLLARGEYGLDPGHPSLTAAPLFPLWIAFLYRVFLPRPWVVMIANAILSAATGALLWDFARRAFSRRSAWFFLAAWTVYPYAIYYCGWTYRETFTAFLVAAMLRLLEGWSARPASAGRASAAGACGGALGLTNPTSLLFVACAPAFLCLRRPRPRLATLAAYGIAAAILYSPWVVRNYRTFGEPVVTNQHGAMNFYYGIRLPADALGTPAEAAFRQTDSVEIEASALIAQGRFVEGDRVYREANRRLLREQPGHYLRQCLDRVVKFWRLYPYRRAYPYGYWRIFWLSLLSDGWLLPMAALGLWLTRDRWRDLLPFYALLLFWPMSYYLVYAVMRFRMPVMAPILVLSAAALDRLLPRKA